MLKDVIEHLRRILPDAFKDEEPGSMIPWIRDREIRIEKPEITGPLTAKDVIFVYPEAEIPEKDEEIGREIEEIGIEALAWYVPFHRSKNWGIYFRVRGICYLSNFFKTNRNINDINERMKRAFEVLFHHEFFHFLTEIAATHIEMIYVKLSYNKYFEYPDKEKRRVIFTEEALANAYSFRRIPGRYRNRIQDFFDGQPPPYSEYSRFLSDIEFLVGKRKLGDLIRVFCLFDPGKIEEELDIREVIERIDGNGGVLTNDSWPFLEFLYDVEPVRIFLPDIPVYFVIETQHPTGTIQFISPIFNGVRIAAYPCDHPPPHIHIWIPAHSRRDGRYLYPTLDPLMGARPLTNRERKLVEELIAKYKDIIENAMPKAPNQV
jgi:hypothetical protein